MLQFKAKDFFEKQGWEFNFDDGFYEYTKTTEYGYVTLTFFFDWSFDEKNFTPNMSIYNAQKKDKRGMEHNNYFLFENEELKAIELQLSEMRKIYKSREEK